MKSNNFQVCRSIWTHQLFDREPFTEREAWMWLVSEAAWDNHRVRVGAVMVNLKRGQVSHSLRWMAQTWQWNFHRVYRFLVRLKIETMIETETETGVTVINICNYDQYQLVPGYNETEARQQTRQQRDSIETKRNTLNTLNTKKDSCSSDDEQFRVFWENYPRKVAKKAAEKAFRKAIKEVSLDAMMGALAIDREGWKEEQFTPYPATWLNQGRYFDHHHGGMNGHEPFERLPKGLTPEQERVWMDERMRKIREAKSEVSKQKTAV